MGWEKKAVCRTLPVEDQQRFFSVFDEEQKKVVAQFCVTCPVRRECIEFALANTPPTEHGVWGRTERERKAIIRERRRVDRLAG